MDANRPAPLTPADCDLRDYIFMPLDVSRLRDSDLAASETPEACWAAVLLWAASWHQVPAASIPNDDRWIAKAAGYAQRGKIAREWAGIRSGALRGWIECSDGRLYHPVVAEKAIAAWDGRTKKRWMTECARIKKHAQRHKMSLDLPSFDEWLSAGCPSGRALPVPALTDDVPRDAGESRQDRGRDRHSKGEGEGEGEGETLSLRSSDVRAAAPAKAIGPEWPPDYREQFWQRYPHKVGKPAALAKLDRVAKGGKVTFFELLAGLDRYIASKPADRQWCNPATWLNQERWTDQPAVAVAMPSRQGAVVDASSTRRRTFTEDEWRQAVQVYQRSGDQTWNHITYDSPEPRFGGCKVPRQILVEYGYRPAETVAA